jgi:23S rRNA (adenine2030-N6)-methyltransferase
MKYRHAYHAGNFADVHKHVTLLALLAALKRKETGFLYLDTHAGRGLYAASGEARHGAERLMEGRPQTEELQHYAATLQTLRSKRKDSHAYPGSPLLAAGELRPQDRGIFIELEPGEARALEHATSSFVHTRTEHADGYARLRAHLPPRERRALTFIDPPYEETRSDFQRVESSLSIALSKFATGVFAAWYPIKDARDIATWQAHLSSTIFCPLLISEIWLYPRDSRVALNGSGLLIANPPYQLQERMQLWLPELHTLLDEQQQGSWRVSPLNSPAARADPR